MRGVSMRVALQTKPLAPLTKVIRAIDFLRSAIAASSPASPVVHAVDSVHAAAALAKGDAVKCSSAPTCSALAAGATGLKTSISCGVSIGLQRSPEVLVEKVAHEIESGYQRIKLKIKPGQDVELVKAVRREFPEITLSVDANSAYCVEKDVEMLQELDDYGLLMIEQPLAAGDLIDHAKLQRRLNLRDSAERCGVAGCGGPGSSPTRRGLIGEFRNEPVPSDTYGDIGCCCRRLDLRVE